MNATFERSVNSQEWYTPKWIFEGLDEFDLDPCSAEEPLFKIAEETYDINDNGLNKDWGGKRVFLNPPYKHPILDKFIDKMIKNNNGIALLFCRFDTVLWQTKILPNATSMILLSSRVKFLKPDGTEGGTPGTASCLVSFGGGINDDVLKAYPKERGFFIQLK